MKCQDLEAKNQDLVAKCQQAEATSRSFETEFRKLAAIDQNLESENTHLRDCLQKSQASPCPWFNLRRRLI